MVLTVLVRSTTTDGRRA